MVEKIVLTAKGDREDRRERHAIVPMFVPDDNLEILDIGCGDGYLSQKLIKDTNEVIGLDLNKRYIDSLKHRGLRYVISDLDYNVLPFKDKSFDIVVSFHVLEHLLRPDLCLLEVHRVLRDDGYAIISVPNYAAPYYCL